MDAPSVSNLPSKSSRHLKCEICFQPAHGNHFGVDSCRACAAFFRRVFVTHKQDFQCRNPKQNCKPDANGRWSCKKCRTDKCISLGMKPDNIQYNRDLFFCSELFSQQSLKKTMPNSCSEETSDIITFFDLSPLLEATEKILSTGHLNNTTSLKHLSSLQKLAYGLREIRKPQVLDNIPSTIIIGKNESFNYWNIGMQRATTWLTYFDEFQKLEMNDKLVIAKCMWLLFTRIERSAMTAELRRSKKCGDNEYAFCTDKLINFETVQWNFNWLSYYSVEQLRTFLGSTSMMLCDSLTQTMMHLQPTDEELCYILCDLCFSYLGNKLGGRMLEITDRLQRILADDLHQYYLEHEKMSRYSHRLSQLLKINQQYKLLMEEKRKIALLGHVFGAFRVQYSHPDIFESERFE